MASSGSSSTGQRLIGRLMDQVDALKAANAQLRSTQRLRQVDVKAVIFDCDGTLVDTEALYHEAYNHARKLHVGWRVGGGGGGASRRSVAVLGEASAEHDSCRKNEETLTCSRRHSCSSAQYTLRWGRWRPGYCEAPLGSAP